MLNYVPKDWYWRAEDGRIYASGRQAIVSADDDMFVLAERLGTVTPWPRDQTGNQTTLALQHVLDPHGLFVDLPTYASAKRYLVETGGFTFREARISTDRDSQSKIGNAALAATLMGDGFSTSWKCADGEFVSFDQASMIEMATSVMTFISSCFGVEERILKGINDGTVSSMADVDGFNWPADCTPSKGKKSR